MRRHKKFAPPLVVFAVLATLPLFMSEYYLHLSILVLMWAFLATAWNILGGYAGQHSLGNGVFMGIGAYGAAYLTINLDLSPWLSMPVVAIAAGLAGAFIGYACFRYGLKGAYFALVTIAITEAMVYIVSNWPAMGGAAGLEVPYLGQDPAMLQFDNKTGFYFVAWAMMLLILLFAQWLSRRRFGYRLVAVRENEDAAEALGVDTLLSKINATALSAALTALGGVFYVQYVSYVGPRSVFGETVSVQILLYAIIGGLGTVWGPFLGALVLVPASELLRGSDIGQQFSGAHLLLYGVVLVMTMLFMPRGIVGLYETVRDFIQARRVQAEPPVSAEEGGEG
jgi:branched-chain amino acid transport system permease protein